MEILYHYCPTESFHAIVRSRSLWLSSLSLTNDTMEGKLVTEAMIRLAKKDSFSDHDIRELQTEIQVFEQVIDGLGFCLSLERDLLSQWRGYAANATGVAIGFSDEYLRSRCAISKNSKAEARFSLKTVVYHPDKHESLVKENYDKVRQHIRAGAFKSPMATLLTMGSPEFEQKSLANMALRRDLYEVILSLGPLFFRLKASAFKEEREVRLCSYIIKNGGDACLHRAVQDRIIPYRPFELVLEPSPIVEVVLGPKHITPPWAVKNFLKQNGYGDVRVEHSTASYR